MHPQKNLRLTCFNSVMVKPFMSDGYLTESKIGLEAGPEYGGPGIFVSSAIRSDVFPTAFWSLWEGANAVTCFHSKKKRKSRVRSKDTERYPVVELRHYGATCRALLQSNESELKILDGNERSTMAFHGWICSIFIQIEAFYMYLTRTYPMAK